MHGTQTRDQAKGCFVGSDWLRKSTNQNQPLLPYHVSEFLLWMFLCCTYVLRMRSLFTLDDLAWYKPTNQNAWYPDTWSSKGLFRRIWLVKKIDQSKSTVATLPRVWVFVVDVFVLYICACVCACMCMQISCAFRVPNNPLCWDSSPHDLFYNLHHLVRRCSKGWTPVNSLTVVSFDLQA